MGHLDVSFKGICTHFLPTPAIPPNVHHVVLVNASSENVINGIRIPPHFARISISATVTNPESQTFTLQGVNLTLNAGGSPALNYQNYGAIPTLTQQMSEIETLSTPDASLVTGEQWPAVAAYFTVDAGTFTSCVSGGAAVARLSIDTNEAPGEEHLVTLHAKSFPGAPPLAFDDTIQLLSPATITVQNLAEGEGERIAPRSHFFLHYLLAANYPSAPQGPLAIAGDPCLLSDTTDAGCSDSNYP